MVELGNVPTTCVYSPTSFCSNRTDSAPSGPRCSTLWRALRRSWCPPGALLANQERQAGQAYHQRQIPLPAAYAQGGAYIGGGLVAAYDGASPYPVGFVTDPIWLRAGRPPTWAAPDGPTLSASGKYYFQVIFERTDACGRISYSTQDFGTKKSACSPARLRYLGYNVVVPSAASSSLQLIFPGPTDGWGLLCRLGPQQSGGVRSFTPSSGADPQGSSSLRRWNTYNSFGTSTIVLNPPMLAVATPAADAPQPYTIGGALGHTQPPCLLSWSTTATGCLGSPTTAAPALYQGNAGQ